MDPEAFYLQAVSLKEQGGPANLRTAASRAYYSAFHVARDRACGAFIPEHIKGSHQRVQFGIERRYGQQLSRYLRRMSRKRNNADYDITEPFELEETNQVIEMRDIFLKNLGN